MIKLETLPLSAAMQIEVCNQSVSLDQALSYALTGGDDYELLFTINKQAYQELSLKNTTIPFSVIGKIVKNNPTKVTLTNNGEAVSVTHAGWDHFK